MRIVCVIAAHDEEDRIIDALHSLWWGERVPERIVVVADNCLDRTADLARACGAEVVETVGNSARKAGALNQAYSRIAADPSWDALLQMDADAELAPDAVAELERELEADPRVGGACARFVPRDERGLLRLIQRMEYQRFDWLEAARPERIHCLDGKGNLLRRVALDRLGPRPWDESSLVEDYVLTLDLRAWGWKTKRAKGARGRSETKGTLRELWRQRVRWAGGTLQTLRDRGYNRLTRRVWWANVRMACEVAVRMIWYSLMIQCFTGRGHFDVRWLLVVPIFALEAVVSAWPLGWKSRIAAISLVPNEVGYALWQAYFSWALLKVAARRKLAW